MARKLQTRPGQRSCIVPDDNVDSVNSRLSSRDAAWLRSRFAQSRAVAPVTTGDGHLWRKVGEIKTAAVLVPVVQHDDGLTVLLTRRTAHLNDHAGQISFPGGRAEPGDASAAATALRETEEEIGLAASRVEVLGHVTPPLDLRPDDFEVAEVFEVPLDFLLDPANHLRNSVIHEGRQRRYYTVPYRHYYIWGATAGMLMNFCSFLTA
jgi:8-oxo-dGTP pyrophosphatase MutT (NUDIX family)